MKILVAYDGSSCSDAVFKDLPHAGLPERGDAIVISVSESWMVANNRDKERTDPYVKQLLRESREKSENALRQARKLADRASSRVKKILPKWTVASEATFGSPAWEILDRAHEFKPDLIILGSHGHSAVSRFVLGSISQKVLTEAECSVRVARGAARRNTKASRIVIGFDCSDGAKAAVKAVSQRNWGEGSGVRLIAVTDPVSPSLIGRLIPPVRRAVAEINRSEQEWIERQAKHSLSVLQKAGLSVALQLRNGNPKHVLPSEAEEFRADCIVVGATAHGGRVERFLLGSTSAAVAARSHCSVEVVRG